MRVIVTSKNFKFSQPLRMFLFEKINNIDNIFPKFNRNLPDFCLIMRRNKVRRFFESSLRITFPKKVLFARFEGDDPINSIESVFNKILKEAETYKGKHFKGYSKYKDHSSIRRRES